MGLRIGSYSQCSTVQETRSHAPPDLLQAICTPSPSHHPAHPALAESQRHTTVHLPCALRPGPSTLSPLSRQALAPCSARRRASAAHQSTRTARPMTISRRRCCSPPHSLCPRSAQAVCTLRHSSSAMRQHSKPMPPQRTTLLCAASERRSPSQSARAPLRPSSARSTARARSRGMRSSAHPHCTRARLPSPPAAHCLRCALELGIAASSHSPRSPQQS